MITPLLSLFLAAVSAQGPGVAKLLPDQAFPSAHDYYEPLIADPRDLIEPHTSDPSDDLRRSQVLDSYRKGQTTQTVHTTDDSGAVSNVAR